MHAAEEHDAKDNFDAYLSAKDSNWENTLELSVDFKHAVIIKVVEEVTQVTSKMSAQCSNSLLLLILQILKAPECKTANMKYMNSL